MARQSRGAKLPSRASISKRLSHSTVPVAVAKAWLSPPSVELTARGNLYDHQTAGVQCEMAPACIDLSTKAKMKPAWVCVPMFAKAASE